MGPIGRACGPTTGQRLFSMCPQLNALRRCVVVLPCEGSQPGRQAKANHITVVRITPPRLVLWPLFPIQCPHCWGVIAYTLNPLCRPRILYPQACVATCMHMIRLE
jgi:hypothetical protein